MGKRFSRRNLGWSGGIAVAGLVVMGACGSRNALPGGVVVDDGTNNTTQLGSAAQATSGGPAAGTVSGQAVTVTVGAAVTTGGSFVAGPTSGGVTGVTGMATGVTTGMVPGTSTDGSIGVGGSPSCTPPDNFGGAGGEGGAPSELEWCSLQYCDGWAPADANCANIQGAFYLFSDQESGGVSTIYAEAGEHRNQICVQGYVNQVVDSRYDVYWGAGFGMSLNQPAVDEPPEPYDAEAANVVGFGFFVDGLPYDGELRFTVRGDQFYCTRVLTSGFSEYMLADLVKGCWEPDTTPHDYSGLMAIEWHFVSNAGTGYGFEMCMNTLTVYRGPN